MTDNSTSAIPEVDRESLIKQHLPLVGTRVIDVGCGEGWLTQLLAPETDSIIGIDPSEASIGRARAAKKSGNETYLLASAETDIIIGIDPSEASIGRARAAKKSSNETYLLASADSLPVDDSWADIVIYYNSLHHVPAELQPKAATETARVLVPGGRSYDQVHRLNLLRRL